jgi:topoisomerase-4 subunit A
VGITRDKEYDLTRGAQGSKVVYFSANPNGEAETLKVFLRPQPRMKKTSFEFDFSSIAIKGRTSQGNILAKHPIKQIVKRDEGVSTLGARDLWFDESVQRLNAEERGSYLGAFEGDDRIMTIQRSGTIKLYNFDLSTHFDEDMIQIMKHDPRKIISLIYWDGNTQSYYMKRFNVEAGEKVINILNEHKESRLVDITLDWLPQLEVSFEEKNGKKKDDLVIEVSTFIGVKSYKAKGKRLSETPVEKLKWLEPLPYEPPEEPVTEEPVDGENGDEMAETEALESGEEMLAEDESPIAESIEDDEIPETGSPSENDDDDLQKPEAGKQITLDF